MFPSGFDPIMEYKRRHKELLKEALEYRLLKEAQKADMPKVSSTSKILALIGKELTSLGARMEERYGVQSESRASMNRQSSGMDQIEITM